MTEVGAPLLLVVDRMSPRGGQEMALREYAAALARHVGQVWILPLHPGGGGGLGYQLLPAPRGDLAARDRSVAEEVVRRREDGWVIQSFLPVPGAQLYVPRGGLVPEALLRRAASQGSRWRRWISERSYPHSPNKARLLRREKEMLSAEGGTLVVAVSSYVADQAARHYGLGPESVRLVKNGIARARLSGAETRAASWRERLGCSPRTRLFVSAAQNFRLKGISTLERALGRLDSQADFLSVVAGKEGEGKGPRCQGRLRFLGGVEDLPGLLAAADLVVHPTFYDPMSRVGLEATLLGRPLLTTRFDGVLDFLGDDGLILADPGDELALARMLASSLSELPPSPEISPHELSMERHVSQMLPLLREAAR